MNPMMMSIRDLTVSYGDNTVLERITLHVGPGRLVGVIGPNGAGKSTLFKAVLGLIPRDRGTVRVLDRPVGKMRRKIAYVPQRSHIDRDFPIDVKNTVLMGTYPGLGWLRRPGRAEKARAAACLQEVGLQQHAAQQIGALSGGQQQRVFMARALARQADLFLLDEPFVGIDMASEATIIKILKKIRNEGKTVIVVHHDLATAMTYFDDIVLVNRTLLASGEAGAVLQPERIAAAYGVPAPLLKAG